MDLINICRIKWMGHAYPNKQWHAHSKLIAKGKSACALAATRCDVHPYSSLRWLKVLLICKQKDWCGKKNTERLLWIQLSIKSALFNRVQQKRGKRSFSRIQDYSKVLQPQNFYEEWPWESYRILEEESDSPSKSDPWVKVRGQARVNLKFFDKNTLILFQKSENGKFCIQICICVVGSGWS